MAASRVVSIGDITTRQAEYATLVADLPGRRSEPIGILLLDPSEDRLYVKLRRDWDEWATEEDAEVLRELADDLATKANEMGANALLTWLESNAAMSLSVTDRETVRAVDFERTLNRLFREHVPVTVGRFRTHLPLYGLSVAAGPFLTNPDDIPESEWLEAPEDLRLDERMFVARIRGRSMEPRIPNGSLCVFRHGVAGSRQGRLVLVRNAELGDENRFTVKRYRSEKVWSEEGFQHTRVRLESLNPAFPSWDLDTDESKYEIVAEFVCVLEEGGEQP